MTLLLDTSVVVRYLTGDPPDLAELARDLVESPEHLLLPSLVIAEAWYTLTKLLGVARPAAVDGLLDLIQRPNIVTPDADKWHIVEAVSMCRGSGRVSCTDALLWATARSYQASSGTESRVYTFDKRFPDQDIEVVAP
jgi:predicted nucleic acid-binding protein